MWSRKETLEEEIKSLFIEHYHILDSKRTETAVTGKMGWKAWLKYLLPGIWLKFHVRIVSCGDVK